MEKIIGPLVNILSDVFPGFKTISVVATTLGMVACEVSGRFFEYGHQFDTATWAAMPTTAVLTIALRKYREAKLELEEEKRLR